MKKMYLAAGTLFSLLVFVLSGCGSSTPKNGGAADEPQTKSETEVVLEVDSLLKQAESLAGKNVVVEGVCTHICEHGGGKIFLMGSDDTQTIRVDAGQGVGAFKPETVNSLVRISGTLVEQRVDEAFLSAWEAEAKSAAGERHGEGGAGCESDQKARGEASANSVQERIDNFRKRIAERRADEGKDYLSFYSVTADSYEIR